MAKNASQISYQHVEELSGDLTMLIPEITKEIEGRISHIMKGLSNDEKAFDELFLGGKQETQDCTKLFQYIVSPSIECVCNNHHVQLRKEESDGYDWVLDTPAGPIYLEQKVKTILANGRAYRSKIKNGYSVCESWTGNKASANGNSKTDLHLLWCFEINGSKIVSLCGAIVSLTENNTMWKTGTGDKDSYADLKISPTSNGVLPIWGEQLTTGYKNRPLKKSRFTLKEVS